MSLFNRSPRIPPVETPEHCKGEAAIMIEGPRGKYNTSEAVAYFSCPGIDQGELQIVKSERSVWGKPDISQKQLAQISKIAGIRIKSMCFNCPFSPTTQVPSDLSQLERSGLDR